MPKRKKKKHQSQHVLINDLIRYLAGILKEVGLPGFITLVVTTIFLMWGTPDQKKEFIDTYILHKNNNFFPCILIIISLLSLLTIQYIYFNRILKLRKEENNRIGREKSALQTLILNKQLNSSK